jgi:hypothetical protein
MSQTVKRLLWIVGSVVALFLMARAVAWPFTVDIGDPATYQNDWGGPSLAGAVAVHCGPGIIAAALIVGAIVRGRIAARAAARSAARAAARSASDRQISR